MARGASERATEARVETKRELNGRVELERVKLEHENETDIEELESARRLSPTPSGGYEVLAESDPHL